MIKKQNAGRLNRPYRKKPDIQKPGEHIDDRLQPQSVRQKTGSYRVSYPNNLRTLRTKTIRAAP